jgi:hypothetical protein
MDVITDPDLSHELGELFSAPIFLDAHKRDAVLEEVERSTSLEDLSTTTKAWFEVARQQLASPKLYREAIDAFVAEQQQATN